MKNDLEYYRVQIDEIDTQIARLLAERFAVVDGIAEFKRKNNLPVLNASRETVVLSKVASSAGDDFAEDVIAVYGRILEVSKNRQVR